MLNYLVAWERSYSRPTVLAHALYSTWSSTTKVTTRVNTSAARVYTMTTFDFLHCSWRYTTWQMSTVTSSSAIADRPRCRVGWLWPKVEVCNCQTIFYGHYRFVFNHSDAIGQQSNRNSVKKTQNKSYYAAEGHSRSSRSVSIKSRYATSY